MIVFSSFDNTNLSHGIFADYCLRKSQEWGTTSTAMIDQCEKLHRAENLSSFSHSAFCTSTAATHHAAVMGQIDGRKEATNLAWRLPIRWPVSRPP
jgi:hypothetical protein